jgi:pSer/pThr/pTyr-binding forkhead associated (FHA) protein
VSRTEAQSARDPLTIAPDAPRVLAGFLVSYEGSELGSFWPLYQGKNVVGRKGAMEGLDIEVDHPTTSSRHAIIHAAARPGAVKIEDPGSTNGTYLNEERLVKGASQVVRDGDSVRFGGYTVTVKIV